ncbi:uncharacterized protein LOC143355436 isoform X2 [Halictus rubicundus]|uniref:uncharacterized protein LOC143355436 isoform X2 n=1 Tax=Halictus rubicundus TaxID=77578 RepID=UPI0040352E51
MTASVPSEDHIRHCILFHFHAGFNGTVTTKNICDVYGDVLKVNKCQHWFRRIAAVEADPKLSIQELSRSLGSTWSTIQRHLHEMGKAYRFQNN